MSQTDTLPRAVTVALASAAFLALLGVADVTIRLAVSLPPPFKAPLGTDVWWIGGAVYLIIGARRRDPRVRLPVFWVALGAAIFFGTVAAPLLLVLGVLERSIIAFGVALVLVVPHAAIAYALSRPSAKAWFAATARA
jgi:hypothetical protein